MKDVKKEFRWFSITEYEKEADIKKSPAGGNAGTLECRGISERKRRIFYNSGEGKCFRYSMCLEMGQKTSGGNVVQ